ncbi:MAG: hypothetical protein R3A10_05710 [Caldilineaceae bacterium]
MVDDAHGEASGEGGRGIVDHFGLHGSVDVEVGTMSKAFGVVGGMVADSGASWSGCASEDALPLLQCHDRARRGRVREATRILRASDELVARLWAGALLQDR